MILNVGREIYFLALDQFLHKLQMIYKGTEYQIWSKILFAFELLRLYLVGDSDGELMTSYLPHP